MNEWGAFDTDMSWGGFDGFDPVADGSAFVAVTGSGTLGSAQGGECIVRSTGGLETVKLPYGTRARALGMAGEHVLIEVEGTEGWVEVSNFRFSAPLLARHWSIIAPGRCDWRFMSWNVLADGLAQSQFADRPEIFEWKVRRQQLLDEVDRVRPDVLGLCELNHYSEWREELEARGYHGTWIAKPKSPCQLYGAPADGCAVFVSGRFDTVENLSFTFPDSNQVCAALLLRDRVLQLECIVAVVHLKSGGSEHDAARGSQIRELAERARQWQRSRGPYEIPTILAGDFNMNAAPTLQGHDKAYVDMYSSLNLDFTAQDYTWGFEGVLDYVFGKNLIPKRALGIPSRSEIGVIGVPCERYPSDHFSLAVDIAYAPELRLSADQF